MKEPVGGIKSMEIDVELDYTYQDLRNMAIECMKTSNNQSYFDNSSIDLGNFQNKIYEEFSNKSSEVCDLFWFLSQIKTTNRRSRLYLLTTENLKKSPVSGSVRVETDTSVTLLRKSEDIKVVPLGISNSLRHDDKGDKKETKMNLNFPMKSSISYTNSLKFKVDKKEKKVFLIFPTGKENNKYQSITNAN